MDHSELLQTSRGAQDFIQLARHIAIGNGSWLTAAVSAEGAGHSRPARILRAAVSAGSLADPQFGEPLAEYNDLVGAFVSSLRQASAFDRVLGDAVRVPLRQRVVMVTSGATGYTVAEGAAKPVTALALAGMVLDPVKTESIIVTTTELLRTGGAAATSLFARELRLAIANVTDAEFLSIITNGLTPATASGTTAANVSADLAALIGAIATSSASRLFLIVGAARAKAWTTLVTTAGERVFPDMTAAGGTAYGVPTVVSDGIDPDLVVLVDASGLAANSDTIILDSTNEGSIQMLDNPAAGAANLVPLWQQGLVALRAERWFGVQRLRASAVATLSYEA